MSRVLIGTPINELKKYCWNEYLCGVKSTGCDVLIVDTSKDALMSSDAKDNGFKVINQRWQKRAMDRVVLARQTILAYARKKKYTHIFWVDADIIVNELVFKRLMADLEFAPHGVISAVYHTVGQNEKKRVVHNVETMNGYCPMTITEGAGTQKAAQIGFGCVITDVSKMGGIMFRCERDYEGVVTRGEDYCWSDDWYIKKGKDLLVNTEIVVEHLSNGAWNWNEA